MASELITILSCSKANCTKPVTNGLELNKQRCHRPTWTTWLKLTYKTQPLCFHTHKSYCCLQCNTQPLGKTCLSSNCCAKRHLAKRVASQQKKKQNTQPDNSCFSFNVRKGYPCSRQSICKFNIFCSVYRTCTHTTPLQLYTLKGLGFPKAAHRFTKSRKCAVSSMCFRMVQRMVENQKKNHNCCCNGPNILTQKSPHKWDMQAK